MQLAKVSPGNAYWTPDDPRPDRLDDKRMLMLFDDYVGEMHTASERYLKARSAVEEEKKDADS